MADAAELTGRSSRVTGENGHGRARFFTFDTNPHDDFPATRIQRYGGRSRPGHPLAGRQFYAAGTSSGVESLLLLE
ncbi:MAG: hypothetical protein CMJ81_10780 [Planctomycetaceae bacterium]|nr:hypothetical protein [Planctomycetaceae bacterium]